jgi:tRNA(Ile)-lysidine synthase
MNIKVPAGKYVLAVSGGVDSMALLDLLSKTPGVELIIAHFNHGIRPDSDEDEKLTAKAAAAYGVPFEKGHGELGPDTSEDTARQARYAFLREVQKKHSASKIITAHHQDDLIETALINVMRGTGRQGLSAMASNPDVLRPLLKFSKKEIIGYAKANKLKWREDSTNADTDYLRNYLRHKILPDLSAAKRDKLLSNLTAISSVNQKIDQDIATLSQIIGSGQIDRRAFSELPVSIGNEVLVHQLRAHDIRDFDAKTISRLNMAIRTAKADSIHPIKRSARLEVGRQTAVLLTS